MKKTSKKETDEEDEDENDGGPKKRSWLPSLTIFQNKPNPINATFQVGSQFIIKFVIYIIESIISTGIM